jgi:hypothetical protein
MIAKLGLYLDMSAKDYFADPAPQPSLTQSIAKILIDRSPAHARLEHPRLCPPAVDDEAPAEKYDSDKAIGNAAHAMLIDRGRDIIEAKFPNFMSKDAKQFRDAPEHDGKIVILSKHLRRAAAMVNAAREAANLMKWDGVFCDGLGEVAIVWTECEFWFRSLIDWKVNDVPVCYDYKSTGMSISPHLLGFLIEKAGWHIQAAFHERGLDVLEPDDAGRRKFRFIAQENYPPYAVVPVELDERWLTNGRKVLRPAIDIWQHCLATDRWPAYPLLPTTPEYPAYREAALLAREIAEEDARVSHRPRDGMLTDLSAG